MLCSAICNQRLKEGKVVKYMIWNEFMSALKNMKYDDDRNEYYHEYLKADILYIDDLLKGNPTDYELKIAFETINYRYNNNMPTIISSELLVSDLRDQMKRLLVECTSEQKVMLFQLQKIKTRTIALNSL